MLWGKSKRVAQPYNSLSKLLRACLSGHKPGHAEDRHLSQTLTGTKLTGGMGCRGGTRGGLGGYSPPSEHAGPPL